MNNQNLESKTISLDNILTEERVGAFIDKINSLKRDNTLDLSTDEDLSIAIMNLISIEEHLFFTAHKTNNPGYLEILKAVREKRKNLLKRIVKEYEGEVWCTSKHLLAASMRLMEVGTKHLKDSKNEDASSMFRLAYELYLLFWGINLKVIDPSESKLIDKQVREELSRLEIYRRIEKPAKKKSGKLLSKLGELVKKAVNCCLE